MVRGGFPCRESLRQRGRLRRSFARFCARRGELPPKLGTRLRERLLPGLLPSLLFGRLDRCGRLSAEIIASTSAQQEGGGCEGCGCEGCGCCGCRLGRRNRHSGHRARHRAGGRCMHACRSGRCSGGERCCRLPRLCGHERRGSHAGRLGGERCGRRCGRRSSAKDSGVGQRRGAHGQRRGAHGQRRGTHVCDRVRLSTYPIRIGRAVNTIGRALVTLIPYGGAEVAAHVATACYGLEFHGGSLLRAG